MLGSSRRNAPPPPPPACCPPSVQLAASAARAHCCSALGSAAVPRLPPAPGGDGQRGAEGHQALSEQPTSTERVSDHPHPKAGVPGGGSAGRQPRREAPADAAAPLHPLRALWMPPSILHDFRQPCSIKEQSLLQSQLWGKKTLLNAPGSYVPVQGLYRCWPLQQVNTLIRREIKGGAGNP